MHPLEWYNSLVLINVQVRRHGHCWSPFFINPGKYPQQVATIPSSALGSGNAPAFCIISVCLTLLSFSISYHSENSEFWKKVDLPKTENSVNQDESEHTLKSSLDSKESLSWRCGFRNPPSSECPGACRPAVVKSIVNDVHHVIWASSLFMLDQLDPYSKQIISYNYQPEDKSLNVFLMIVLWLAGVKSASQGQRLKMSSSQKSFRRGCCAL